MAKKPVKKATAKKATAKKSTAKKASPKSKKIDKTIPNLEALYASLEISLNELNLNKEKFESGNASAGRRIRKAAQEIKRNCQFIRVQVQNKINENK